MNSLFRCAAELLRTQVVFDDLSEIQLKTVTQICQANVANFSTQAAVFVCLRALLHRRFESVELYDLMMTVQELMVTHV